MYAVQATITHTVGTTSYQGSKQVPTFYLHENVQGILSEEQARTIAQEIINPTGDPNIVVHASVEKVFLNWQDLTDKLIPNQEVSHA